MRLVSRGVALLLVLAVAAVANAQVQTGSILVKVADEQNAVQGLATRARKAAWAAVSGRLLYDLEAQDVFLAREPHVRRCRSCVLRDVRQSLGADVVRRGLEVAG